MPITAAPIRSRKAQIDRTATALFRARGFAATSMRELATALGLEAGSLYSHIKSKEEILHRVCFGLAEAFLPVLMLLRRIPRLQLPRSCGRPSRLMCGY